MILAGISIASLTQTGLFGKTQEAKQRTENAQAEENTVLGEYEQEIANYTGGTYKAYNVGDQVIVGGENFYVIKASGTSEEKVSLLAAKNIGVDSTNTDTYLKQSDSAGTKVFSSTNYWSSETSYPLNLNNYESESITTTDAIEYAKAYGTSKGGTGRLMTVEEAFAITGLKSSGTISSPNWMTTTKYWLGSAHTNYIVWVVGKPSSGPVNDRNYLEQCGIGAASIFGVRPVIEISKSKI